MAMNDPDTRKRGITLVDSFSRFLATAVGLLYLVGFLVVAGHLSRYGASSFSVLQLQYLVAGVWALGPPAAVASVVLIARRFEDRVAPETPREFNWRRFVIASFLTSIPYAVLMALLSIIPGVLDSLTWGTGIRLFMFYIGMLACAQVFWMSWQSQEEKASPWRNRSHAAPFYMTLLLTIVLGYVLWFSVRVYPLIPFSLGGGRPLTVAFIASERPLPEGIVKDGSSQRSVPYKLLMETDKSYVVLSPEHNEESIEFARDSVDGMVVLKDFHAH
jgi:MFS family permease